ncbi:oxidoreductase [Streptomyces antibioticus]|uniref:oxidoreductase n=1 Tax=Streptomyces antibioticus TaxID=1890 RepID=UPI003682328B
MNQPVAWITGASSGIGTAIARRLAREGHIVYGTARRLERLGDLEAEGVRPLALDVTDDDATTRALDRIIEEQGRIDVLVNNAGYGSYGALEDVPADEGRAQFDVNVFAPARLTQLVLPHMRAQRGGTIVNVSSIGGKIYGPLGSWYHATKFALEGMSDALRVEVAPFGIRVVLIEPGAIRTEWNTIARDNLMKVSGNGPYARLARSVHDVLARADAPGTGSSPEVVADAVARAVTSDRPKARYAVGASARPAVLGRKILTDRALDRIVARVFKATPGQVL